jgi:hypothetical protein
VGVEIGAVRGERLQRPRDDLRPPPTSARSPLARFHAR